MTEESVRRPVTRRHVVLALFACASLASTVVGRLTACAGCSHEMVGVPLSTLGMLFYVLLGLMSVLGVPPLVLGSISLPGLAIQAGLVRYLIVLGAACWTCLAAAVALFAFSLACLIPRPFLRYAPVVAVAAGAAVLPLWSGLLVETTPMTDRPPWVWPADLKAPPENATLFVIYGHDGCPFCRVFERDYEPRLLRDFGAALAWRRVDARKRHQIGRLPSFVIGSPDGSFQLIKGLPPYADLAAHIRRAAGGK